MAKAKDRVGEINYNKFGSKMEIIAYRGANDIDVYFGFVIILGIILKKVVLFVLMREGLVVLGL